MTPYTSIIIEYSRIMSSICRCYGFLILMRRYFEKKLSKEYLLLCHRIKNTYIKAEFLFLENKIMIKYFWVTKDSGQDIIPIWWTNEQLLCQLIARSKKYWPVYTGFNQGNTKRFWYSCVIVSWLRSWFTLWASSEDFTALMYDLCTHMENKWLWKENEGWMVSDIWDEFVIYMNARFPTKKVWKTKVKYGSSAMWGCLARNIPIVTAYLSSQQYYNAQSDWDITETEINWISKSEYWHCITITGIWPLWLWLKFQDNYEWQAGNTYRIFNFKRLLNRIWYANCFWALLPEIMEPTKIKDRSSISQIW